MKSDKVDQLPLEPNLKPKSKPKAASAKYEGSRFSSLLLLIVTILISLAFYAAGQ
jgi:hypothetical protein